LRLKEYSFSLLPPRSPPKNGVAQLPRVQLVIHRWDVVTGDRNDPEYFPRTKEVGLGGTPQDTEVNRILRKWWLGE
jgi:hypothetical protein